MLIARIERKTSAIVPPAPEAVGEGEKSSGHMTTSMIGGDVELPGAIPTDTMRREPDVNSPNLDDSHQLASDVHYGTLYVYVSVSVCLSVCLCVCVCVCLYLSVYVCNIVDIMFCFYSLQSSILVLCCGYNSSMHC